MIQRLPITFAEVKAGNTSQNLLMKSGQSCLLCIEKTNSINL